MSQRADGNGRAGAVFVVHKHAARTEHYDIRLEVEGVLRPAAGGVR